MFQNIMFTFVSMYWQQLKICIRYDYNFTRKNFILRPQSKKQPRQTQKNSLWDETLHLCVRNLDAIRPFEIEHRTVAGHRCIS